MQINLIRYISIKLIMVFLGKIFFLLKCEKRELDVTKITNDKMKEYIFAQEKTEMMDSIKISKPI